MSFNKENLVEFSKIASLRTVNAVRYGNKLYVVGLGFIGLAIVGSLFVQLIDPNQIQVGYGD